MTLSKRKNKTYTHQFKEETVALVTDQGYLVIEAAEAVGVRPNTERIGYVTLRCALNKSGFAIDETRTRTIMCKLSLKCTQSTIL